MERNDEGSNAVSEPNRGSVIRRIERTLLFIACLSLSIFLLGATPKVLGQAIVVHEDGSVDVVPDMLLASMVLALAVVLGWALGVAGLLRETVWWIVWAIEKSSKAKDSTRSDSAAPNPPLTPP
jgi:hypothetical protein